MAKDTYIPRDEVVEMHKEFNKVRKKAEKELMAIPGVLAIGVGLKEIKGELQRELCFKVTVEKKKNRSKIKVKDQVPETIYGFKTDVVEKIVAVPLINEKKYRPLIGGCQIQSSSVSGRGTLGCFAKRKSDDKIVLLTNWHVMMDNANTVEDDDIGQPSHNGCCACCATGEFATIIDGRFDATHDTVIGLLHGQEADSTPSEKFINEILDIGLIAGSADPKGGETVYKYGKATGFTKGQILNDSAISDIDYEEVYDGVGSILRTNQIAISPVAPFLKFSDPGDSGSVTVNEHNQVIALNYGGDSISGVGLGIRISLVETDFNIEILDSSFQSGVALGSITTDQPNVSLAQALSELETELSDYKEGKRILELFKVHRVELLDLVRHKREVMAAWHRYQGPAYLAHIARSVRRENKPIPDRIKGISLQNLLLKMTAVLQRNGSVELSKTVSENYLNIVHILSHGKSPEDWKENLADLSKSINIHLT